MTKPIANRPAKARPERQREIGEVTDKQRRGRAAASNRSSLRVPDPGRTPDRDAWDYEPPAASCTTVTIEKAKRIVTRNQSPDVPFDRSINAYRGCEHGCIYCFARPTHAWHGLSPGLDFETRLFAKPDAARLLHAELDRPGYTPAPIAMGTNTDPYQPIERDHGITRSVLQVLSDTGHPCTITTKNHLVTRDIDVLSSMAQRGLVTVNISVTSLDLHLSRRMEPRASAPARRLAAIRQLSDAGIPVNLFLAPLIPALNDHEIEAILEAGATAGARGASCVHLRLPHEVKLLFREWLALEYPDRAERVMHHVRAMRDGKDNEADFGKRMRGSGPYAELMSRRFAAACAKHGLTRDHHPLRTDLFRKPARVRQPDLFDLT